jgi:hypothetical protein
VGALFFIVWRWRPGLPYWDEWETALMVRSFDAGHLTWQQLWALHNEHRILIPRLLDLALIETTAWNRQIEMTFDLVVGVATACLLFLTVAASIRSAAGRATIAIPFALVSLSFAQYADWLAPFQLQFIVTAFGVACCAWALSHSPLRAGYVACAIIGAVLGSLSGFSGLLIWFSFLPSVWRNGPRVTVTWFVAAVFTFSAYLVGFHTATQVRPSPVAVIEYILAYLGAPIGLGVASLSEASTVLAIALVLCNLAWVRRAVTAQPSMLIWVDVALFALLNAVVTALGRASAYGVGQATESRYQMFSSLAWLAFLVLSFVATKFIRSDSDSKYRGRRMLMRVNSILLAYLLLGLVCSNALGIVEGVGFQRGQTRHQGCVVHFRTASDACLARYFPDPSLERTLLPYLASHHYGIFSAKQYGNQ